MFPSRLNLPSPQLVQLEGAAADSLKFALQVLHLSAPTPEQVLQSRLQSWHVVAVFPSGLTLPASQGTQLEGAVADSLKFALQAVHLSAPTAVQVLHSELQSWHVVAALASGLNLPASQVTQLAGAVALSFRFALHEMQPDREISNLQL